MGIEELEAGLLQLPEDERARLAGKLLASLPAILVDEDDGIAEAERRNRDLDQDPTSGMTWEEIKSNLDR